MSVIDFFRIMTHPPQTKNTFDRHKFYRLYCLFYKAFFVCLFFLVSYQMYLHCKCYLFFHWKLKRKKNAETNGEKKNKR